MAPLWWLDPVPCQRPWEIPMERQVRPVGLLCEPNFRGARQKPEGRTGSGAAVPHQQWQRPRTKKRARLRGRFGHPRLGLTIGRIVFLAKAARKRWVRINGIQTNATVESLESTGSKINGVPPAFRTLFLWRS